MKAHRWAVVVTLAVSPDEARLVDVDHDILLDVRRSRSSTPIVCFDCRVRAPNDDSCGAIERDGYPT